MRLINLTKKNDTIASVCKVMTATDEDEDVNEENSADTNADVPADVTEITNE